MNGNNYDIFISYRREGGYDTAKHLNDLLVRDGYKVSFDIDTLRSGDFDTQLLERIDQCKDFILIVDQHCFDRTLDSNFDPKKDWLRCELAYALKKHSNIVPVFLTGVKGFPGGLPSDVASVTKRNGPEYNRYYFNDFYEKLKTSFLTSKPKGKTRKYVIMTAVLATLLGVGLLLGNIDTIINDGEQQNEAAVIGSYQQIAPDRSFTDAKKLFIDVAGRNPVYAVVYTEDIPILIGLVNDCVLEGDAPDSKFIVRPNMSLIRYHNENGVWMKDFSKKVTFDKIMDLENDADVICIFDDAPELFSASQQIYLYFHLSRGCFGTASANVTHDFIALNLMKGTYHFLEYMEYLDSHYSDNGTLLKEDQYPKGIEELLAKKFAERKDIQKAEETFSEVKNCFKQWNADNPKRPDIDYLNDTTYIEPGPEAQKAYKEYIKQNYGRDHPRTAIVRMYDECPQFSDGTVVNDHDVSSMRIQTGDFVVYSVWRGPVVAQNTKTGDWFVVWDEEYNYSTKYIRSDGDGLITMEYIESTDIDDNTDVIHYDLNTHKYYFAKEKYTGAFWPN